MNCPLCKLEKLTEWFFECKTFVVIECCTCHVPMYVWRSHIFPSWNQIEAMISDAKSRFPEWRIDFRRRKISDHYHFHLRRGIDTSLLEGGGKLLGEQKNLG